MRLVEWSQIDLLKYVTLFFSFQLFRRNQIHTIACLLVDLLFNPLGELLKASSHVSLAMFGRRNSPRAVQPNRSRFFMR